MSPPDHAVPIENLLRHRAWVRNVARALVRGAQDADDLEQEAWLAAVRQPPPEDRAPKAWLGTVLRRTAAKLRLRDARRETRERDSAARREASPAADVVAQAEMHERVVRSVLGLPEPYRTTILRRYFEDLTPREIAARDGTPLETVRARLRRGLALLRSELRGSDARAWPVTLVALAGSGSGKAGGAVGAGVVLMTQAKTAVLAGLAIVIAMGVVFWAVTRNEAPVAERPPAGAPAEGEAVRAIDAQSPKSAKTEPIRPRAFDARSESEPAVAESQADAATGTLDVRVIWGDDKTPAAAVGVHVVEWGTRSGMWKQRDPMTGPDGTFQLKGVAPGKVGLYGDRGGGRSAEVKAGEKAEVVLEIPPAPTILGTVVDPAGKPVPGADIWLSHYGNHDEGAVIARSDANGEFLLRCVSQGHSVAARARGHGPSAAYGIREGKPGETIRLRVVLGGPAGSVRGLVTRSDGTSVSGATIRVTPPGDSGVAGHTGYAPPPVQVIADEKGAFLVEGLPEGANPIAVRLAGLAPWSGSVEVTAGETAALEVRLPRQAVVLGTVRLASGEPAAGADVLVGGYGDFLFSMTKTAPDGSFRLDSLAPGSIAIRASVRGVGKATATLECAEGDEVKWNPVIDAGLSIRGVVRDDHGKPLAGWVVNAHPSKDPHGWWGQATVDSEGRFQVVNLPTEHKTFRVEVWAKGVFDGSAIRAVVEDVAPGENRTIVISPKALATLKGRVIGPDGKPAVATVRASPLLFDPQRIEVASDPKSGSFSIGPMVPGRWRITVDRKPLGTLDLGDRDLAAGELDLGDVTLAETGKLSIDLAAAEGVADRVTYEVQQTLPTAPGQAPVWPGTVRAAHKDFPRPLALGPGTYSVELTGSGLATKRESFEIRAGGETRVRIAAEAAEGK
jgi:RNA polymerase sigma factor (sigma-70 family)